jgi:hypothetical protein
LSETIAHIKDEQKQLVERANKFEIKTDNIGIGQGLDGEFSASVVEVILEGLRWTQPPLLDRKDNSSYGLV